MSTATVYWSRTACGHGPGRTHVIRLPDGPDGPRPIAVKRLTRQVDEGWWAERDNTGEGVDSWLVGAIREQDVLARVLMRTNPRRARSPR